MDQILLRENPRHSGECPCSETGRLAGANRFAPDEKGLCAALINRAAREQASKELAKALRQIDNGNEAVLTTGCGLANIRPTVRDIDVIAVPPLVFPFSALHPNGGLTPANQLTLGQRRRAVFASE